MSKFFLDVFSEPPQHELHARRGVLAAVMTVDCIVTTTHATRMWANAQRDGRPAKHGGAFCSAPQSLADAHY